MKKTLQLLLCTVALGAISIPAYANHEHGHGVVETTEHHAAEETDISVKIDGMVCDFCARALEKVFSKQDNVLGINVDLDTHIVTIDMKDGTDISDEDLTKLILDSGYNVAEIKRP